MTGLRFQTITVQTDGGYNDGVDSFLSEQPSNQTVINARFDEDGNIKKRYGMVVRTDPYTGSYGPAHSLVDVDGVPHAVGLNGTFRYDTLADQFTSSSYGSPRHIQVKSDPIVRGNNQIRRPDTAVNNDNNIMCQVWEDVVTGYAYYQFWQLVGDEKTPVALTQPKTWTGTNIMAQNVHVLSVGSSFVAFGFDTAGTQILVSAYQIGAPGYSFSDSAAFSNVTNAQTDDYAVCNNMNGDLVCYVAFRTGTFSQTVVYSFDNTGTMITNRVVGAASSPRVLAMFHHAGTNGLNKLLIGHQDGSITHFPDDLSTAGTNISVISVPASTVYHDVDFRRAMITREQDGSIWFARSTANYATLNAVGNAEIGGVMQLAFLNTSFSTFAVTTLPRLTLVSYGGFLTDYNIPVFVVADQMANATRDGNLSGQPFGYLSAPVAYIVQPVYAVISDPLAKPPATSTPTNNVIQLGRCLQDLILTTENGVRTVGSSPTYYRNWHMSQINATISTNLCYWSTTVVVSQNEFGVGNAISTDTGYKYDADLVRFKLQNVPAVRDVQASNLRLLGGGSGTTILDGVRATQNTPDAPTAIVVKSAPDVWYTSIPISSDVIKKYRIVHRWTDSKGNRHRSSPSSMCKTATGYETISVTKYLAAKLCFSTPYPSGLMGDGFLDPLVHEVEVYGQQDAGTVWRLLGVITPEKDPTDESLMFLYLFIGSSFVQLYSNSIVISDLATVYPTYPELYTDSGELGAYPTPPLIDLVSTQSRLWGLSAERRLEVWYSKPIVQGFSPEFSSDLVATIPQDGGECVALASLGDKVAVFKQRKIFVLFGDPGDNAGNNSSLQRARLIPSDVGCISPQSVVEGPYGVVFQTERGFYKLSRDEVVSFVGKDVKNYQDISSGGIPFTVSNGTDVPAMNEVRWTVNGSQTTPITSSVLLIDDASSLFVDESGNDLYISTTSSSVTTTVQQSLIWNYRLDKWSVNDVIQANDACISDGVYQYIGNNGYTIYETPNSWNYFSAFESAQNPRLKITTSWIKLTGLADYKRIKSITVTLKWFTGGITARTRTDYTDTWETSKIWTEADLTALADSSTNRVQLVLYPTKQKCESIQLEFNESASEAAHVGRAFEIVGLQMVVGMKKGSNKRLPAEARK